MTGATKSKRNLHTSTPAPNRKVTTNKKLFEMSPLQALSPIVKKLSMMDMIIEAIKAVGLPRKGASLQAIKKWIVGNSESTNRSETAALKRAIEKGLESGTLIRPSHSKDAPGITGWFILAPSTKKVKSSTNEKETKKTATSPKANGKVIKKPKAKEQKPDQNIKETIKKGPRKGVKSPKKSAVKQAKKSLASLAKVISKTVTKKKPKPVKISKKGIKIDNKSTPKRAVKKGLKSKPPTTPNLDENGFIFTDSDGDENVKHSDQQPELAKGKKRNKSKGLKQEKSIKTKEPRTKDTVPKNTIDKTEKVVQSKKTKETDSNIKDIDPIKQSKKIREPLENGEKLKPKVKEINDNMKVLARDHLDVTRKDLSDTEIDTRPNRHKSIKSYASDTELELSRRISRSKKMKSERKPLTKKIRKNVNDTVASTESEIDNTKTKKNQSQSKLRKAK